MAELTNCQFPLLVLCSDMLLPWNALLNATIEHKKGTFTWITSSKYMPAMEKYYGLKVRPDGAVIYDTYLTPEGRILDDGNLKTVSKGGSIIVDPELFIKSMNKIELTNKLNGYPEKQVDIFWDVIPLIEKQNQLRILNGEKSILNAVIGDEPVMDIGTPETLDLVRKYLNNQK